MSKQLTPEQLSEQDPRYEAALACLHETALEAGAAEELVKVLEAALEKERDQLRAERDEACAMLERLSALFEAGWGVVRTYEADLARPPKAAKALESVNRARSRLMAACGWEGREQEALRRIRDAKETTWEPGAGLLRPTTHDMREAARWGLGEREQAPWEDEGGS